MIRNSIDQTRNDINGMRDNKCIQHKREENMQCLKVYQGIETSDGQKSNKHNIKFNRGSTSRGWT
ncbi:hypothetical protein [Sphingobacterium sp.]|uniref:hypothetical protein n=1 Tax=Sphingobacterium sp. TaxID=341027 RepID=UPI002897CDA4|nr:hypothetical protein [Sphingobacterium sp.]